jgi:hypothetical protein
MLACTPGRVETGEVGDRQFCGAWLGKGTRADLVPETSGSLEELNWIRRVPTRRPPGLLDLLE